MIFLGVDPSSSCTGLCWHDSETGELSAEAWRPQLAFPHSLKEFISYLRSAPHASAEVLVVERVSVAWNLDTVRKIAYFEAVAMLYGVEIEAQVIQCNVSSARSAVWGKKPTKKASGRKAGNYSKRQIHELALAQHPHPFGWAWLPYDQGGGDQSDALTLAKYGAIKIEG